MSARDFAGPLIVAAIAALLIAWWSPEPPDLAPPLPEAPAEGPYPLLPTSAAAGDRSILLHLGGAPRHGHNSIVDLHAGTVVRDVWVWDGTDLLCLEQGDCIRDHSEVTLAPGAQNGTFSPERAANMTFFIFTSKGRLLSTNTAISVWGDYDLDPEFTHISGQRWWFGESDAPPGAQQVPEFRAMGRALLDGVPVGGVRSALLEHHEYEWLVGPLWVTVRVDSV